MKGACSEESEDLTAEVNRGLVSSGQRQEQSGRLARNSLCLGVWDYSSKFTQSALDWQAEEESEVTARGETTHTHTYTHTRLRGKVRGVTVLYAAHQRV